MGANFIYIENVPRFSTTDKSAICTVEVVDCHGIPELRIGPKDEAHEGYIASFKDWKQFESFVEAVNTLHSRLEGINNK